MFTNEKENELKKILWDYRWKLNKKIGHIYGKKLSEIYPLAEKIIADDPYLSLQDMLESSAIKSGKFEEDLIFIMNTKLVCLHQ